ncbi:uncharacterized protein LOC124366096 [Homalodisca vitripennis]|nr:uncharacterized protein LOC124366096 [Homalodisca vitripennis]XP_046678307.1 uncharacterized protein LOC124366096 [Homalodisca vitripennis]XP_046678308.1 uncharacterized protein LOC124366096 [Homalodisca vitripennis]KAG8256451.1 hypothetical protein J6590_068193 [Homalodisca vitripennis]
MGFSLSFPNCLCLVLTGVLVVHMFDRDLTSGGFPELPDNLEVLYCKLPQSYRRDDLGRCSSTQRLFLILGNDCSMESKPREITAFPEPKNETEQEEDSLIEKNISEEVLTFEEDEEGDLEEEKKPEEEMTSSLVDSFVISLLLCSAIVSLLEWYREKTRSSNQNSNGEIAQGMVIGEAIRDRRISLADLTVNRHIRRRDSQQQEAIRQSFSSPSSKPPPLLRRSSFPAQFPENRNRHAPQRQQSNPGYPVVRRMSIDLTEDDSSPDRRRVRFIRRH